MAKQTSLKALKTADIPTLRERVMMEIRASNEYGMTNYELCKALKKTPNSISPRLGELEEMGHIVCLREERINPNSRKSQNVYVDINWLGDRPYIVPTKQKSKQMEDLLELIKGRVERKGSMSIVWMDAIYNEILEVLR